MVAQPALAQGVSDPVSAQQGAGADEVGGLDDSDESSGDSGNTITVTGTLISNNENSPTPITAVETSEMAVTTPSDIADGLNKLPQIIGGRTPRTQGNGSTNNGGNVLSLRNFGAQRTLVLLDGHRLPPSNQDGTINVDTLPQMLVSRVDIVTGGASATYGSDAVAGVVNYVLDKDFTGVGELRRIKAAFRTTATASNGSSAPPGAPICSTVAAISRPRAGTASRR